MKIGELAERTGTSVRMLRYYEQRGLLVSARNAGGQRVYGPPELDRVELLRTLFAAGLSSRTIAAVMPCMDDPNLRTVDDAFATMSRVRDQMSASMAAMSSARDALDHLIAHNLQYRAALSAGPVDHVDAG